MVHPAPNLHVENAVAVCSALEKMQKIVAIARWAMRQVGQVGYAPGGRQVVSAPGGLRARWVLAACQVDAAPGGPGDLSARWRQVG